MARPLDLRKRRIGAPRKEQKEIHFGPSKRRREPLRTRRLKARLWSVVFAIAAFAVLIIVICWASYLPRFNVQAVMVQGASAVNRADVEAFALQSLHPAGRFSISASNIFFYNAGALEKAILDHFPPIKTAHATRTTFLSTTVDVSITERQPFALWCEGAASSTAPSEAGSCYEMDDSGAIYASASGSDQRTTPYTFTGGLSSATSTIAIVGATFIPGHLDGLVSFLKLLEDDGIRALGADVVSSTDFNVPTKNGMYLKVSFGESATDLINNLELILRSDPLKGKLDQIEYIDLRFGDRVYYKLKTADSQ